MSPELYGVCNSNYASAKFITPESRNMWCGFRGYGCGTAGCFARRLCEVPAYEEGGGRILTWCVVLCGVDGMLVILLLGTGSYFRLVRIVKRWDSNGCTLVGVSYFEDLGESRVDEKRL